MSENKNYSDEKLRTFLKFSGILQMTKKNDQKDSEYSIMTQNFFEWLKSNENIQKFSESTQKLKEW